MNEFELNEIEDLPRKLDTRALSRAAKPPPSLRFPAALEHRWDNESQTSLPNFFTMGRLLPRRLCIRKARLRASWNTVAWAEFLAATMYGMLAWERRVTESQSPALRRKMMQEVAREGEGRLAWSPAKAARVLAVISSTPSTSTTSVSALVK